MDAFLRKKLAEDEMWITKGEMGFSSKVVPVHQSIDARQWVLPTEQMTDILQQANSIALKACLCRSQYQRCEHPLDVCLVLNAAADELVEKGMARYISLEQATAVIQDANERGLIHLSFYEATREPTFLCTCCACCCYELQLLMKHHRRNVMVQADYIAVTDMDACTSCGLCIDRCLFKARFWKDQEFHYTPDACYGCGLCLTVCPVNATVMKQREERVETQKK
jgi:NAD-dependent dihydropyrimidine dehydrogenase PreA subunit